MARRKPDPTRQGAQQLTQVIAGTRVRLVTRDTVTHPTVGAYHPTPPSNRAGHWYCVTHAEHFENQLQKDMHIHAGTHQLAWICHEHGIEQPTASEGEQP